MSREWTDNQKKAIEARGMQVLVSAAAGSGKTAVLTERVKRILCDVSDPCMVNEILVVTFTKAAAAEMRERIYKAIEAELNDDNENNEYLRRQMNLLPVGDICTIDSFCSKLIKDNFHLADVSSDFKILDDKDNNELMQSVCDRLINELYEENDKDFISLTKMFLNDRDDSEFYEILRKLYEYSRAYPSPQKWLSDVAQAFSPEISPENTVWADYIFKYALMLSEFHINRLEKCISLMDEAGGFSSDYYLRFRGTADKLKILLECVNNRNWDGMVSVIKEGIIVKPYARNSKVDEYVKELTKNVFDDVEKDVGDLKKHTLPTSEEHKKDCEILYPVIKKLCDSVIRLTEMLDAEKKELNSYSFDDILHKTLDLLVTYDENGNETETPLLKELRNKYKEILIDEYQDTNEAQNKIFRLISRDCENMYVVGDVKQSIYRFRLASPDLFIKLKDELNDYDGSKKPSKIILEKNFRSREGIDKTVNFIFSRLMTRSVGEIDYNEDEYLYFGADYYPEKHTPDTEIICINDEDCEEEISEPQVVASYIKRVMSSGVKVTVKDSERNIKWGDFCILLRSTKNKAEAYAEALKANGIPVSVSTEENSSDYKEIQFLSSLIRVVNNPLIDIPLISVLMSPVFGFTADELAEIRMIDSKADLYVCLVEYAKTSVKAESFLRKLKLYRNVAASHSVDELVKYIINDLSVYDIYYAAGEGEQRRANIKGFISFAENFVENGRKGLNDFVRALNYAIDNGEMKSAVNSDYDDNCVKIMSIHKSKGLEFPYVILADCSKGFNRRDSYNSMTLSKETGIGLKIRDDELFTRYHSLSSSATEKAILFGDISEEIRILYVALTRAKEHLAFICDVSGKTLRKKVRLNSHFTTAEGKISPYAIYKASNMSEWLLSCFAFHKDCKIVRDCCGVEIIGKEANTDFGVDVSYVDSFDGVVITDNDENGAESLYNKELLEKISNRINYVYPFDSTGVLAKVAASSTEKHRDSKAFFATKKPQFLKGGFTGADKGNAVHKFLEFADFEKTLYNVDEEIKRLSEERILTDEEINVLDVDTVKLFVNSDIIARLLKSKKVLKEYEFSVLRPAEEIYENVSASVKGEQIVVQGKLDCAFIENGEAVLIDYKTDKISDESIFVFTYKNQLDIYADALYQCLGVKVKEKYIFSFNLKKFIKID